MEFINSIVDGYHDLMDNKSDQRVKDWFLMSSPFPTLAICLTYVFIVKVSMPIIPYKHLYKSLFIFKKVFVFCLHLRKNNYY